MQHSQRTRQRARDQRRQTIFMVIAGAITILALIATGLYVVKAYFLPELQRHRHRSDAYSSNAAVINAKTHPRRLPHRSAMPVNHVHPMIPSTTSVPSATSAGPLSTSGGGGGGSEGGSMSTVAVPAGSGVGPASGSAATNSSGSGVGGDEEMSDDVLFGAMIAVAAVFASLPIPTLYTVTCVGAGFALNFGKGLLVALPSVVVGIVLMFAASRRWLHDFMNALLKRRHPALHRIVHASQSKGPVVLLRLTPVPFAMQTMLWGACSPMPFNIFFPWTMAVVVPQVALFVYVGSSTTNLSQALNTRNPAELVLLGGGVVLFAVGYSRLSRWAKHEVEKADKGEDDEMQPGCIV